METTRSVPKNMQYILRSLGQFQTQRVQLSPTSNNKVSSGQPVTVRLPTTGMIDLHSFAMAFTATCTANNIASAVFGPGAAPGCSVVFPKYTSTLIKRLEVLVGGAQADNITDYNRLYRALLPIHGGFMFVGNQAPSGWTDLASPTGTGVDAATSATNIQQANLPGVIDHFMGFMSGNPRIIDASLFPPIELRITLADGGILEPASNSADTVNYVAGVQVAPINPRFELDNIHFSIQTYRFVDDMISSIFYNQLAQGATLPFQWKTWSGTASSVGAGTQHAIKSTISNASASKVLTVMTSSTSAESNQVAGEVHQMFDHPSFGQVTQWQYDINGNYQTPTYLTPVYETWLNSVYAFNDQGNFMSPVAKNTGYGIPAPGATAAEIGSYYFKNFAMIVPLNMPCAGDDYQTGLDTRGTASVVVLRITGLTNLPAKTFYTWVESEARMDIGAGRQSLIQL